MRRAELVSRIVKEGIGERDDHILVALGRYDTFGFVFSPFEQEQLVIVSLAAEDRNGRGRELQCIDLDKEGLAALATALVSMGLVRPVETSACLWNGGWASKEPSPPPPPSATFE